MLKLIGTVPLKSYVTQAGDHFLSANPLAGLRFRTVENVDVARFVLSGIPIVLSECRQGNPVA